VLAVLLGTRQAEVGQDGPAGGIDQDVAELEVTVDDAAGVQGGEGVEDLAGQRHRLAGVLVASDRGQSLGQGLAFDVDHDHVGLPVLLAHVVDGTDVRVPDLGGGAGLTLEALEGLSRAFENFCGTRR
jgi:hypothetical protein